ncbi:hypothetical protein ODE01S_22000 [Oceanithermus desulfurans NBRC 100063]|uniref:Uncharacterized protein n=1 Tax=Oceanithermus desulfurans NBRC 100063 TaxID=1227550 RepID=A0A511RPR1_9DEIN|nr:hypothetical protein ODE01S_22000 [Oceanithermus desulfurans NBRC 100063]
MEADLYIINAINNHIKYNNSIRIAKLPNHSEGNNILFIRYRIAPKRKDSKGTPAIIISVINKATSIC